MEKPFCYRHGTARTLCKRRNEHGDELLRTSLTSDAERVVRAVRDHRGIENSLHLSARHRFQGRRITNTERSCSCQLCHYTTYGSQSLEKRNLAQEGHQDKKAQGRLGYGLPCQDTGGGNVQMRLPCLGHVLGLTFVRKYSYIFDFKIN